MATISKLVTLVTRDFGSARIWLSEYGYQSNPPDRFLGVSLALQARYMSEGAYADYLAQRHTVGVVGTTARARRRLDGPARASGRLALASVRDGSCGCRRILPLDGSAPRRLGGARARRRARRRDADHRLEALQRLAEGDVVAVRVLHAELAKTMRRVVDGVVDRRAALLHLRVDRVCIIDADVHVPHFRDKLPVRDNRGRVAAEREQHYCVVARRRREVRRVAVGLALETEPVAPELDGAVEIGDEQDRGTPRQPRHASIGT